MLLRAILCGEVWNGFLLGQAKKEEVPCRFFGGRDGDGHLFWDCSREPERCFGAYPSDNSSFRIPPDFWDADDLALEMTDTPNIWNDGIREDNPFGGFEVPGAGVYLPAPKEAMRGSVWGCGGGVW